MGEDELKTKPPRSWSTGWLVYEEADYGLKYPVSAGRLELPANGLKGQRLKNAYPIQEPAIFA